ncbi:hypothetical protein PROFUN_10718 [Planoprotostelium fungivorum]|uniref:Major facilitator superfamily (MFS) profile domain-containing protein n=1 Tax=Planoprotostelium fungivorum TaxID=1890364 RepID=A0A2P6N9P0_9EUKA|nr:hypothetical protein PROFUN_10718 [Planoprotostelium fungivorum]
MTTPAKDPPVVKLEDDVVQQKEGTPRLRRNKNSHQELDILEKTSSSSSSGSAKSTTESQLVSKLDRLILPLTVLIHLAAYLDRGIFGNSRLLGLQDDILDDSKQFDLALSLFFIGHVLFMIPGNLLAKVLSPPWWIGSMSICWAITATLQAAAFNFAGIGTCRFFLGVFEAGFGPAIVLYFSFWYRPRELALRNAVYISSGPLAGAFSGLISYGISRAHDTSISRWRIMFLVEGFPSIILGIVIFLLLPDRPHSALYLTEKERELAVARINAPAGGGIEKIEVVRAFKDYRIIMSGISFAGFTLALASTVSFLPSILADFDFDADKVQLYTVPPYLCAFVTMLVSAYTSDKVFGERGLHIVVLSALGGIGYLLLLLTTSYQVKYLGVFLVLMGIYPCLPLTLSWVSNNIRNETRRAVGIAAVILVGNCFSIMGTQIFPSSEGPRYVRGFTICCVFLFVSAVMALLQRVLLQREKRLIQEVEMETIPDDSSTTENSTTTTYHWVPTL